MKKLSATAWVYGFLTCCFMIRFGKPQQSSSHPGSIADTSRSSPSMGIDKITFISIGGKGVGSVGFGMIGN